MSTPEIQFAQQIPVIESGIAMIKLGLFVYLTRAYEGSSESGDAISLAYCVVRSIFFDPINQPTIKEFADRNFELIESELEKLFFDSEVNEGISLAYAVRIMELGWQTCDPFNDQANRITQRASDHSMVIPNIVQMWGPKAITTFFEYAMSFMSRNLSPQNRQV